MLTLLLLRHAKASHDDDRLEDIDRPLNGRGWSDAEAMGQHMAELGLDPQIVLCSPAKRTRETWAQVSKELAHAPEAVFEPRLYNFDDDEDILDLIHELGGAASPLLVIGHNPTLERLALRLCDRDSGKLRERMERKYPTATLAVFEIPISAWSQLAPGLGRLTQFMRPKDL